MNKLQHLQYLNLNRPSRYADNITAIQVKPSLDLNFARNKSLIDNVTGNNLVTFTRASSGTFVNSNGVLQSAPVNFIRNNTMQGAVAGTPGTTPTNWSASTSVNGLSRQIIETGITSGITYIRIRISGTTTANNVFFALSTYDSVAASNGQSWTGSAYYRLQSGALTGVTLQHEIARFSPSYLGSSVSTFTLGSGSLPTQRYTFTTTLSDATVSTINYGLQLYVPANGTNVDFTIDIGLPQLEQGSSATEIIRTTGTINSAPRFDHNPTTGESLGLLVEEQRTNSIRNNTMQGAVAGTPGTLPTNWAVIGAGTLVQQIVGIGTANGIAYIDLRFSGTSSTTQVTIRTDTGSAVAAANGQTWTYSTWCSVVAGSLTNITSSGQTANLYDSGIAYLSGTSTGAINTTSTLSRTAVTATIAAATTAFIQHQIYLNINSGAAIDITLRIGMPQLEQGAFATSVIPTTDAAATRSADVASITGTNFSSWYRQDEGTVFAESRVQEFTVTNFSRIASLDRGDATTNFAAIVRSSALNRVEYSVFAGTGQAVGLQPAITFAAGSTLRSAFVYKTDDFIAAANGTLSPADTLGTVTTAVTTLGVGMQGNGGLPYNGTIRRITYFPQRISNANLQKITQ